MRRSTRCPCPSDVFDVHGSRHRKPVLSIENVTGEHACDVFVSGNHDGIRTLSGEGIASSLPDLINSHSDMCSATLRQTTGIRPQESVSVFPPCCMASAIALHQPLPLSSVSAHEASPPLRKKASTAEGVLSYYRKQKLFPLSQT